MANFIQQFNAGGITYDLHDSEFIIDTRTASGAALTGETKAAALFDGMQITYWLNYAAGSSATMNLTLADGTTTGAIPIYYSGTTRLTTHYAAGNVLHMTYRENAVIAGTARGEGWWCDANYYSDSNYDIFGTAMDVDTAIYNYSLFAITGHNGTIAKQTNTNEAGTYWKANSFTQSSGTGTSKKATTKGYYPYKIFYNPNNTSYTTAGGNTSTVASGTSNLDLRYTVNGSTSANIGATGAPFFLVGAIESDGLFYLKGSQATKEWWTAGIPTTKNTDYVYWFVGMMTSAYQVRLSDRNWFLKWTGTGDNDKLVYFEPWFTVEHADSADSVPWSGVTGKPDTFTPTIGTTSTTAAAGNHSHGYISNDGSISQSIAATPASGDKIVITDSSDSDKVKGSITIGSDDGKFLKHDGTWGEEVYEIEVEDDAGEGGSTVTVLTPLATLKDIVTNVGSGKGSAVIKYTSDGVTATYSASVMYNAGDGVDNLFAITGVMGSGNIDVAHSVNIETVTIYYVNNSLLAWRSAGCSPDASLFGLTAGVPHGLQVGSNGNFSWEEISTDDHILVMTGTPTGDLTSAPITTTTSWTDYTTAVTNHDRLVLNISLLNSSVEFRAQENNGSRVNVVAHITNSGTTTISNMVFNATEDSSTHNVTFQFDSTVVSTASYAETSGMATNASYASTAGTANSVEWSVVQNAPTIPDTPDAPPSDGNYVLNVNSGSSSWQEAPEGALIVEFNGSFRSETLKTDIDAAISEGRPIYMLYDNIVAVLLSKMTQSSGSTYAGDYYYFIVPTHVGSSSVLYPQTYVFQFIDGVSHTQALPLYMTGYDSSDFLVSDAGSPSSLTYSSATASRATLTNGLLSFGDVSASNITNWSAGTTPTLTKGTSNGMSNLAIQTLVTFPWD